MKCPHCNQEHPEGYQFCPATGKKIETLRACKNPLCADFGKHIWSPETAFCPSCGMSLNMEDIPRFEAPESMTIKLDEVMRLNLIFVKGNSEIPDFYISDIPITQGIWNAITERKYQIKNEALRKGIDYPMCFVSIQDTDFFVDKLNNLFLLELRKRLILKEYTIDRFTLPSVAQWEYVAREGNKSYYLYSGSNCLDEIGWYKDNSNSQSHEVRTKKPNALKIYDMCGNIAEWCRMDYFSYVTKGGSWDSSEKDCRIESSSNISSKQFASATIGFRVVLELERR